MKLPIRPLLATLAFAAILIAIVVSRYALIEGGTLRQAGLPEMETLTLGMDRDCVEDLLRNIGAEDISAGMSTYTVIVPYPEGTTSADYPDADPVNEFNPTGMWHLSTIDLTVETKFTDGKLSQINTWDWTGREMDRYHDFLEYDSVSELSIPVTQGAYSSEVIETYNQGVNPPVKSGG